MKQNYSACLKKVLEYEGGYVNHPSDPGGATNKGITQNTYNAWLKKQGMGARSVRDIPMDHVEAIYRNEYWNKVKGDQLPAGCDLATFDFAVNSGVSRAVKYLQRVCGVTQDGLIGPMTLAAIKPSTAGELCDARLAFLKSLSTWPTFGRGWSARVSSVKALSAEMARSFADEPEIDGDVEIAPEPPPANGFKETLLDLLAHDDTVRMEVYRVIYEVEAQLKEGQDA